MNKAMPLLSLTIGGLILFSTMTVMANDKGDQLYRTMADISLLSSQMSQRKDDAIETRDQLIAQLKAISEEAKQEIQDKKIETQAQALENSRIFYDMRLMAEIQAYVDRYTQRIRYYRVACDRLGYLYQQADDDLKIIHTLSDLKIEALINQVGKVLDGYLTDAQTLVIKPETLSIVPLEQIWTRLNPAR